jgi:lipoic acid synthetase
MDTTRKPAWLRARLPSGPGYAAVRGLVDQHKLHTVCQSAQCSDLRYF